VSWQDRRQARDAAAEGFRVTERLLALLDSPEMPDGVDWREIDAVVGTLISAEVRLARALGVQLQPVEGETA
jgi:hypothetical protein